MSIISYNHAGWLTIKELMVSLFPTIEKTVNTTQIKNLKENMHTLKLLFCKARDNSQLVIFIFFVFSGMALIVSYVIEPFSGVDPCPLCIAQKYIHGLILLSSGIGILQSLNEDSCIRTCQILLLISFLVATVHCLIQFEMISDFCARPRNLKNIDLFKELLQQAPLSCQDQALKLFELPLPCVNALGSLSLFFAFFKRSSTQTS